MKPHCWFWEKARAEFPELLCCSAEYLSTAQTKNMGEKLCMNRKVLVQSGLLGDIRNKNETKKYLSHSKFRIISYYNAGD